MATNGGFDTAQQLVPRISRAETATIQLQHELRAVAGDDSEDDFVDAEQEISENRSGSTSPAGSQSNIIDVTSDDKEADDADETKSNSPDLFQATFGNVAKNKKHANEDEDDEADDKASGKDSPAHTNGCTTTTRRLSTPPLPGPDFIVNNEVIKNPTPPKSATTTTKPPLNKEEGRLRPGPDIDRDLSPSLRGHFRFHDRVVSYIPRLNAPDFDWSRRYWIAVLLLGKRARNATNEKDFVWMKGNRLSTGKTIWHRYVETTMADAETTVLMLGHERLEWGVTMEECDLFGDRFVLLRAVERGGEEERERSLVEGVVVKAPEVVELE